MGRSAIILSARLAVIATAGIFAAGPALAAEAASTTPVGNDISYPQCGKTFPSKPAFGIVGVNGGLANDLNPCLGPSSAYPSYKQSELFWAASVPKGGSIYPEASLYLIYAVPLNIDLAAV